MLPCVSISRCFNYFIYYYINHFYKCWPFFKDITNFTIFTTFPHFTMLVIFSVIDAYKFTIYLNSVECVHPPLFSQNFIKRTFQWEKNNIKKRTKKWENSPSYSCSSEFILNNTDNKYRQQTQNVQSIVWLSSIKDAKLTTPSLIRKLNQTQKKKKKTGKILNIVSQRTVQKKNLIPHKFNYTSYFFLAVKCYNNCIKFH